jgi:hypothetical protein
MTRPKRFELLPRRFVDGCGSLFQNNFSAKGAYRWPLHINGLAADLQRRLGQLLGRDGLLYATKFSPPLGLRLILARCRLEALAAELEQS